MKPLDTAYRIEQVHYVRFDGKNITALKRLCKHASRNSETTIYAVAVSDDGKVFIDKNTFQPVRHLNHEQVPIDWFVVWDFNSLKIIPRGIFFNNYKLEDPIGDRRKTKDDNK